MKALILADLEKQIEIVSDALDDVMIECGVIQPAAWALRKVLEECEASRENMNAISA
jgi:hypothetical protein